MKIDVLIPGPLSPERAALASCALSGNQLAIDALETIRRVEAREPVGPRYVAQLNALLQSASQPVETDEGSAKS